MYVHKNGITLVKLRRDHLPMLEELKNESWFGTHGINFVNSHDQEKWFESLDSSKQLILVASYESIKVTDRPIGLYKINNIDWLNRMYDSGHDIFKDSRGMGLSKPLLEAGVDFGFEVLNMNRINTEVLSNNVASYKTALYVGFVQEGVRRSCVHKCGEYLDSNVMGLLRDEWKISRQKKYGEVCNQSYKPKNDK